MISADNIGEMPDKGKPAVRLGRKAKDLRRESLATEGENSAETCYYSNDNSVTIQFPRHFNG